MDGRLDGLSDGKADPTEMFVLEEIVDLKLLEMFCEKFDVEFVSAEMTHENWEREPMYYFSDNLGGYTIDAIRESLE